ncbi:MAG: Fe-S cluster assembly protein SufD, partial [Pseudomonadales bacterium]|nr:Fe-S cluster assembly protein SufD [Pseudomonadales bacterium]
TRKTEAWKSTNLRALERGAYLGKPEKPAETSAEALRQRFEIPELGAGVVTFVNGHYSEALSDKLPDGVELVQFSSANEKQSAMIRQQLGSLIDPDEHMFAALNDTWLADGLFLSIARDVKVDTPIQIVWLTLPQDEAFSLSHRLLVVLDEGSEATVVEHFVSDETEQNCFTNSVTELLQGANSRLYHYRLHLEEENGLHIGGVHARLDRDARLDSFHLALGGILKRIDAVVNYAGEGASCSLNGVYLPRHNQHVDYHTCIEHAVPHCTTTEVFRGIVSDRARAVFNGRIHIHENAQKTRAELSNKNLLTSDKAEVDTKPELEIYADDVQCAHGAPVAQLEEEALYYLGSRGISRKEAEVMLSFGFINELVDKLPHRALGDYLRPILAALFAEDERLSRHIS